MAEKILNTRVLLKIDTLENWNSSTIGLKKGEIAIATIAASAGTGLTEPVTMIKVGEDGVKTFKDLPWSFHAKASDVLTACKSESALTAFVNNVISNAGIATNEAMTALAGRVTTAEGEIDSLQALVGSTAVATQIQNAIDALKLSETYAAKSHTHTKSEITDFAHEHAIADVTGLQAALDDAKKAGTDANTALEAYKVTNDAAVKANTDAISAINNADTGILAQAKSYADGKDTAIADAKKAGTDAQTAVNTLASKVGTVADGKTVVQMISEAQDAATYDDTALATRVTTAENDIDALEGLVGTKEVSVQIDDAIAALNLATTYEAKGAAATAKSELIGTDSDTAASNTIKGAKKYADDLDAAMDTRVDALEAAIGKGGSVAAQITAEIQKLDKEDAAVAGQYVSAVSEADGIITVTRAALPDYTDTYAPKTHTHAIADVTDLQDALNSKAAAADVTTLSGKVDTLIGTDASKSARSIAAEEVAKIVAGADESFDTLKEIADWISNHKTDATAMNTAITKLEAILAGIGGEDEKATVVAYVTDAIDALKNGDVKSALDRIAPLEAASHTHTNKALLDTYTQTEADLADAVAKKHSHANATVLDGITAEKVAAWDKVSEKANDADLAAIAKTGNVNDLVQTAGDVIIFNCGSASEVV